MPWELGGWYHMKALGSAQIFGQIFSKEQSPNLASFFLLVPHGPWRWYSLTKSLPRPKILDAKDNGYSAQDMALESKRDTVQQCMGVAERQVEMPCTTGGTLLDVIQVRQLPTKTTGLPFASR